MSTFWSSLIDLFMPWVEKTFGTTIASYIRSLLEGVAKDTPDPQLDVAAAPPDVKEAVRRRLSDLVDKALAGHPVILLYLHKVISGLPLTLLDEGWDTIFAPQIKAGKVAPASHLEAYPVTATKPTVVRVAPDDIEKVKAEMSRGLTAANKLAAEKK